MSQASISKKLYFLKTSLPWMVYMFTLTFITAVITFLVFTGKSANNMHKADALITRTQNNVYNSSDSFYRELSFQASVISLLTIITICVIYHTFKSII